MTLKPPTFSTVHLPHDALSRLMQDTRWHPLNTLHRDGLINWRHYAAVSLRNVPVEPVALSLAEIICQLEEQTTAHLIDEQINDALPAVPAFNHWRAVWSEHFLSWRDPVRDLILGLAEGHDAQKFARLLHQACGEVFLDYALDICLGWASNQQMAHGAGLPHHPRCLRFPLDLEIAGATRPIEELYRKLYSRFREKVLFITAPVPEAVELNLNYDRLFPHVPEWTARRIAGTGA